MVVDCFTYNGELDMLRLHLDILGDYVDKFIIVEAKTTFSGKKKALCYFEQDRYFRKWWKKIDYFIVDERYTPEEISLAESSPNTLGASHWKREFLQKESIKKALSGLRDEDTVYIGDVDEIWEPVKVDTPQKLKLRVYAYYLDNRSDEEFWGTLASKYKYIRNETLNHLRSDTSIRTPSYHGWHFTSMGGIKEVRRKLSDSYTDESYNRREVLEGLEDRVQRGVDYLQRPFSFRTDESEWPQHLKDNRRFYAKLCRPTPHHT